MSAAEPPSEPSLFEQLGGEPELRRIVTRFVDRVMGDVMIGFFFARVDRSRLIQRELEFSARHLGADIPYTGRTMPAAHAPHHIMGAHFMRRLQILKETLKELQVSPHIAQHWIDHTMKLLPQITTHPASECAAPLPAGEVSEKVL
ncbi:MAG: group 1 truncated hemoglobin [Polyangiaceae bacterium]|nr:group 1 truncated hemoglobin [Polyangiaceae bacterium]